MSPMTPDPFAGKPAPTAPVGAGLPALTPAPEPDTKPWWQSRAIIGALVVVAAQGLRFTGWQIDTEALTDAIVSALTLAGAALAWWGRVSATRPISRRQVLPGVEVYRLGPATATSGLPVSADGQPGSANQPLRLRSGAAAPTNATDPRGAFHD